MIEFIKSIYAVARDGGDLPILAFLIIFNAAVIFFLWAAGYIGRRK